MRPTAVVVLPSVVVKVYAVKAREFFSAILLWNLFFHEENVNLWDFREKLYCRSLREHSYRLV